MNKTLILIAIILMISCAELLSQTGGVKGVLKSAEDDSPIIGASVMVQGTTMGTRTNTVGEYNLEGIPQGNHQILYRSIGYKETIIDVVVKAQSMALVNVKLEPAEIMSETVQVIASRAEFRETPVAFSNVSKQDLELNPGTMEIPMILNETPSLYSSEGGGGYGDSRMNLRGFKQNNVAVMVNGVPVNDMENGWVYWSNWNALRDASASIQVQRGLGASRIANPSVGGTVNIISDAADNRRGVKLKQEYGSSQFLKSTIVANSGKVGDFAVTFMGSRTTGDGVIDKTWIDDWSYYLAMSFDVNKNHKLDFYLVGTPQQHGQRSYKQGMAVYDKEFALKNGMNEEFVIIENERGITYNENWGKIANPGKEYYNGEIHDARFEDMLMTRQNYYHKPQMNLNWLWTPNESFSLTNVFYVSLGSGGGVGNQRVGGTSFPLDSNRQTDLQGVYEFNSGDSRIDPNYDPTRKKSNYILTNSVNEHFWVGYLGTADFTISENSKFQGGIDFRYYEGYHWREIRNLLGGDYYIDMADSTVDYKSNPQAAVKGLGDKIGYHNDGIVRQAGAFLQYEYKKRNLTTYANVTTSLNSQKRFDYFRRSDMPGSNESDWQNFLGFTVKTGANYNLSKIFNIYGNVGYYSLPPLIDAIFRLNNTVYNTVGNEEVMGFELGVGSWTRELKTNLNLYYTIWNNQTLRYRRFDENDNEFNFTLPGLDALHMGAEFDMEWRPIRDLRLRGMVSIGNWTWTSDIIGEYSPEESPTTIFPVEAYLDGIKVGDAAQTSFSFSATYYPIRRSSISLSYRHFSNYFADFDPEFRTAAQKGIQPWELPSYGIFNLFMRYTIPMRSIVGVSLMANVLNMLDTKYIADAEDARINSGGDPADRARVYFGRPRTFVIGLELEFR
ncbi:MAG: hypothetical protein CVV22_06815 [Ignavibacteriae bacterium HGW-Ignavibacteriae-1]|nr:MAG: hypothetical protein CVV22_06815 [Ignavibacteriae bacterium HGW-Ignavibacteriae-1]